MVFKAEFLYLVLAIPTVDVIIVYVSISNILGSQVHYISQFVNIYNVVNESNIIHSSNHCGSNFYTLTNDALHIFLISHLLLISRIMPQLVKNLQINKNQIKFNLNGVWWFPALPRILLASRRRVGSVVLIRCLIRYIL